MEDMTTNPFFIELFLKQKQLSNQTITANEYKNLLKWGNPEGPLTTPTPAATPVPADIRAAMPAPADIPLPADMPAPAEIGWDAGVAAIPFRPHEAVEPGASVRVGNLVVRDGTFRAPESGFEYAADGVTPAQWQQPFDPMSYDVTARAALNCPEFPSWPSFPMDGTGLY